MFCDNCGKEIGGCPRNVNVSYQTEKIHLCESCYNERVRKYVKIEGFVPAKDIKLNGRHRFLSYFITFLIWLVSVVLLALIGFYPGALLTLAFFFFVPKSFNKHFRNVEAETESLKKKSNAMNTQTDTDVINNLCQKPTFKCGNCGKYGPYNGNCPVCNSVLKITIENNTKQEAKTDKERLNVNDTILFCRKCGIKLMPDEEFCRICGTKI